MEILNYFLISLVVYLGLLAGIIISYMAKEELKPGKRYFILAHNITLAFILYFILEFIKANVYIVFLLPLAFVVFLFYYTETYKKSYALYPILGGFFFIVSSNNNQLLIMSGLIFFYGFLIGTLQTDFKQKNYLKILGKNLGFFVCAILILLF